MNDGFLQSIDFAAVVGNREQRCSAVLGRQRGLGRLPHERLHQDGNREQWIRIDVTIFGRTLPTLLVKV
ncbi:MAG: hypothetical protein F6K26_22795 [Moorea sp. SIO2I5]|nr:hypothetical protein [Moorena sp. SIO2I5]